MSKTAELTRKDMKEPDRFQQIGKKAAGWVGAHRKAVIAAGGVVVVVGVVVTITLAVDASRGEKAGAEASSLLAAAGGEVSKTPLPGAPGPVFPNEDARQKAVLSEAAKVVADYPRSAPAKLAMLAEGDAHFRLGEWDQAAQAYGQFLAATDPKDSLRFGALEGLAYVAEQKGDLEGAAKAWQRLGKEAPAFADRADLEAARVLGQSGKGDDAKKLLEGFAERHPGSLLAQDAAQELATLGK